MYLLPFEVFLVWDRFVDGLTGLKWLGNNLSTTWYDLTPTGQRGKLYEKKSFTFDFHILPEHRLIDGSLALYFNKNGNHPWDRCWPIYLESKPSLNCWIAVERAEITFISTHINLRTRRRIDSSSIIAHPVNFDKDC